MKHKRPTCEEIAARAYQIHLESGRRHGHYIDDWLQAEYELMHMSVTLPDAAEKVLRAFAPPFRATKR